ncbi:hypothetical protein [Arenibaculum sp.]|jgi:hypothetical protein|uniref:hypothetical protein n=1 Tax=Arenibaculum sp. TaxID=2865862 RepID=UPI002E0E83B5|nr:hypothetical protein [Arenibaculum sp.]
MSEWTIVQFPDLPDIDTRRAILAWVEEMMAGRCLHFNTTDGWGRRAYGFQFQRPDDAQCFRRRWLAS